MLLRSYSAWDDASSAPSRLSEVPRLPSVDSPPPEDNNEDFELLYEDATPDDAYFVPE